MAGFLDFLLHQLAPPTQGGADGGAQWPIGPSGYPEVPVTGGAPWPVGPSGYPEVPVTGYGFTDLFRSTAPLDPSQIEDRRGAPPTPGPFRVPVVQHNENGFLRPDMTGMLPWDWYAWQMYRLAHNNFDPVRPENRDVYGTGPR